MASVSIRIQGLDVVIGDIEAVEKRLEDLTPAMETIASDLQLLVDDAFDNEESPWAEAWEGLSDATISINPRREGGQVLSDTRRLRNSLSPEIDRDSVSVGTNVPYAATHQFGKPDNRLFGKTPAPIPARPFLPIDASGEPNLPDEFMEQAENAILDYLLGEDR